MDSEHGQGNLFGNRRAAPVHGDRDFSKGKREGTSAAAFRKTSDQTREKQRRMIVNAVRGAGPEGRTCEELSTELGIRYTSASGRISELRKQGRIRANGERRKTSSGRSARVYHVKENFNG